MNLRLKAIGRISTADRVLRRMTSLIERGRIGRGMCFPAERELAAQLGVSRGVVREATVKLEQNGLVRIRQGIGVEVINRAALPIEQTIERQVRGDHERLRQCAQARMLIEPELSALAALHATPEAVSRLQKIQESMSDQQTLAAAVEADLAFHEAIAEIAGNRVLALMLSSVAEIGRASRLVTMERFGINRAREQHMEILAMIRAGDAAGARKAMKRHLLAVKSDLD